MKSLNILFRDFCLMKYLNHEFIKTQINTKTIIIAHKDFTKEDFIKIEIVITN